MSLIKHSLVCGGRGVLWGQRGSGAVQRANGSVTTSPIRQCFVLLVDDRDNESREISFIDMHDFSA